MCGIIGIVATTSAPHQGTARSMMNALTHRGPDADGITPSLSGCILGHRRLSIVDLATGAQPMSNSQGTVSVTFNGEIYGYKELREQLSSYPFRTHSDTETILALYEIRGNSFVRSLPGMFAFALWDERSRTLIAARDRFGEKPFYYAFGKNGEFLFASEIKALLASNLIDPVLDEDSVAHYLHKLYVHPHQTIYKNVFALPPAHQLTYRNGELAIERYWNLPAINDSITMEEAVPEFTRLLTKAVRKQLVADVPVGAFLSGGLDSSTVVALASQFTSKLKTFAFGYEGTKNELPFARAVANQYETEHFELHDHDQAIAEAIVSMADVYDEPLADSSTVSTYLISKLTRAHTTVVLSGDGSDELLGGYHGWNRPILSMGDPALSNFPGKAFLMRGLARAAMRFNLQNKVAIIDGARGLQYRNKYDRAIDAHRTSNVFFKKDEIATLGLKEGIHIPEPSWPLFNSVEDAMRDDVENYMPGDILTKTDRASMAHSLELRAPFLDTEFAEFALSLPYRLKITADEDKVILRRAFETHWPEKVRTRKKLGFGAPVHLWLKRPEIAALVEEYVHDPRKKIFDTLSYKAAQNYAAKDTYKLWILLTLSLWMEKHSFTRT